MATVFRSNWLVQLGWTWRDEQDRAVIADGNQLAWRAALNEGIQAGQANSVWYTLGASLSAGTSSERLLDALTRPVFGKQITQAFSAVKAMYIANHGQSAGTLVLGGASSNPWTGPLSSGSALVRLTPGGVFVVVHSGNGWGVTAAANRLKILAESGAVAYDLVLVGIAS